MYFGIQFKHYTNQSFFNTCWMVPLPSLWVNLSHAFRLLIFAYNVHLLIFLNIVTYSNIFPNVGPGGIDGRSKIKGTQVGKILTIYLPYSLLQSRIFAGTRDWTRACSIIMSLMHILLNSTDIKSGFGSSRWDSVAQTLYFHLEEAGADAKLIQLGPPGFAYHRNHPISTVPVARITADFIFFLSIRRCTQGSGEEGAPDKPPSKDFKN